MGTLTCSFLGAASLHALYLALYMPSWTAVESSGGGPSHAELVLPDASRAEPHASPPIAVDQPSPVLDCRQCERPDSLQPLAAAFALGALLVALLAVSCFGRAGIRQALAELVALPLLRRGASSRESAGALPCGKTVDGERRVDAPTDVDGLEESCQPSDATVSILSPLVLSSPSPLPPDRPTLAELQALNLPGPPELRYASGGSSPSRRAAPTALGTECSRALVERGVLVAVRVRPLGEGEDDAGSCLAFSGARGLAVSGCAGGYTSSPLKPRSFAFDCVFRPECSQQDVYELAAQPVLQTVVHGYNGCVFAYGQTGSGKTWTMHGDADSADSSCRGVVPRMCEELFEVVHARGPCKDATAASRTSFHVTCSLLELYNEALYDLLAPGGASASDRESLQIREDSRPGGRGIYVEGATEVVVESAGEVLALYADGQARRATGRTNLNDQSSRSHLVFTLHVTNYDHGEDPFDGGASESEATAVATVSKLCLVDLAGSERQKTSGTFGQQLREGSQINLSLSALGNVINALTEPRGRISFGNSPMQGSPMHAGARRVPYRDSKLTRLLQDSLGGNSVTSMICTLSPSRASMDESLSSLRFAERALRIENEPVVNRDAKSQRILELKALRAKVARLEGHIARLEEHY